MNTTDDILQELDHLEEHVANMRRLLLAKPARRQRKGQKPLSTLDELIKEVSERWSGPDAVTEIREQREKGNLTNAPDHR